MLILELPFWYDCTRRSSKRIAWPTSRKGGPPSGGPPSQNSPNHGSPGHDPPGLSPPGHSHNHYIEAPNATSQEEAIKFVAARIAGGADYIKIMIEEGSVLKAPGPPLMTNKIVKRAVSEVHSYGKLAIAHTSRMLPLKKP